MKTRTKRRGEPLSLPLSLAPSLLPPSPPSCVYGHVLHSGRMEEARLNGDCIGALDSGVGVREVWVGEAEAEAEARRAAPSSEPLPRGDPDVRPRLLLDDCFHLVVDLLKALALHHRCRAKTEQKWGNVLVTRHERERKRLELEINILKAGVVEGETSDFGLEINCGLLNPKRQEKQCTCV